MERPRLLCAMKTNSFVLVFALAFCLTSRFAFAQEPTKAVAVLSPTANSKVTGTVTFTQSGGEVKVVADINGLTPGKHGFHIHEFGDCSAPDGASAGSHWNPTKHQHGAPDASDRHAG